jgi:hypothetical protein
MEMLEDCALRSATRHAHRNSANMPHRPRDPPTIALLRSLPLLPKDAGIYAQVAGLLRKLDVAFVGVLNPKQGLYQIATENEQVDALAAICQGIAIAVQHYRPLITQHISSQ